MLDIVVHKWLHVPYRLYVRFTRGRASRRYPPLLFIHGIGNSGAAWDPVIRKLPANLTIVAVDLLGFGNSPRPDWVQYDVATQARAVLRTWRRLSIGPKPIIIGHSLGALVAIEIAKQRPKFARSLILASPPLYQTDSATVSEKTLLDIYSLVQKNPKRFVALSALAMKYDLINNVFNVTDENVASYMGALRAAIINQTSLRDIGQLKLPIRIIRGRLDPVLVAKHITRLGREHKNITVSTITAGHEVTGRFADFVARVIRGEIKVY